MTSFSFTCIYLSLQTFKIYRVSSADLFFSILAYSCMIILYISTNHTLKATLEITKPRANPMPVQIQTHSCATIAHKLNRQHQKSTYKGNIKTIKMKKPIYLSLSAFPKSSNLILKASNPFSLVSPSHSHCNFQGIVGLTQGQI